MRCCFIFSSMKTAGTVGSETASDIFIPTSEDMACSSSQAPSVWKSFTIPSSTWRGFSSECRYTCNLAQTTALPCSSSSTADSSLPPPGTSGSIQSKWFNDYGKEFLLRLETGHWEQAAMESNKWLGVGSQDWTMPVLTSMGYPFQRSVKLFLWAGRMVERIYCFPEKV